MPYLGYSSVNGEINNKLKTIIPVLNIPIDDLDNTKVNLSLVFLKTRKDKTITNKDAK